MPVIVLKCADCGGREFYGYATNSKPEDTLWACSTCLSHKVILAPRDSEEK